MMIDQAHTKRILGFMIELFVEQRETSSYKNTVIELGSGKKIKTTYF